MRGKLHPTIKAASKGELPAWTKVSRKRFEHMERVARLLRQWAKERGESREDVRRWTAVGYLHDALRGAKASELRPQVPDRFRQLPGNVLHGPAAAAMLRRDGLADEPLLRAIEYHTLGSWKLDAMGRALYVADFLEPGRSIRPNWRRKLRKRMPEEFEPVIKEIVAARVLHLVQRGRAVRPETIGFWNSLVRGRSWASASEV
jgi:2-amino-4-hydroxy-6-hydroxymethyldihydropteridine diphosphokinase